MLRLPKRLKLKKLLFIFLSFSILFISEGIYWSPSLVDAQTSQMDQINVLQDQMAQLDNQISQEETQIQQNNGKIQNTADTISQLQRIIAQKEELINDKQNQINLLNQSITNEKNQIDALNTQINTLYALFVSRARASYEESYVNPFFISFGDSSINDTFTNLEYFANTRNEDAATLSELKNDNYDLGQKLNDLNVQQTDLENAQTQLLTEKNSLQGQQQQLQGQLVGYSSSNKQLENQVTSNQQEYQSLVNEINSLQIAVFGGNTGCVKGNYWYYNQQCYGTLQGMYGTSIDMTYGCLIADIAMVATKEIGPGWSPPKIASMTYFSDNFMEAWPSLPGISPVSLGYQNISAIDSYASQDIPVITYLSAPDGEHWVVIYGKTSNGDYIINDPWYGSSLSFNGTGGGTHEYYSKSEIGQAFVLQ